MFSNPDIPLILLAAAIGGIAGRLSKMPGGPLLMATICVAVTCNYWGLSHVAPWEVIIAMQVLTGSMLGQSINRRFWQDILEIWRPTLVVVGVFTLLAVPFAFGLTLISGFDPVTAVLATTPARMQDMIVLASSTDADAITVMAMQLARQFAIISVTPFMLTAFMREEKKRAGQAGTKKKTNGIPKFSKISAAAYAYLLIPGCIGAFFGHMTGHILGALLGAFFLVAFTRIASLRAGEIPLPRHFGLFIQCMGGFLIGARITPEIGTLLMGRLVPLVAACLYVLAGGLLIARILAKRYNWHKGLSWMAAAPGRTGDMLAMSQDINLSGRERLALASVHAVRQVYFTLVISVVMAFF